MNARAVKTSLIAACALVIAGAPSCRGRNEAKERIQEERGAWEASLPDSLKKTELQSDSLKQEIETLTEEANRLLPRFDYVDNPREVEGYYISKNWKGSYPLRGTGLVMRITKGEKAELIAALAGGGHFNRIRVEAGGNSAESGTVPYDQALNYRMAGLNTVCFSDSASDSCARLIADNEGSDVTIIYLNDGKQTGKIKYSAKSRSILAETWQLYDLRKRVKQDERMIPLLARKSAIISSKIDEINEKGKNPE